MTAWAVVFLTNNSTPAGIYKDAFSLALLPIHRLFRWNYSFRVYFQLSAVTLFPAVMEKAGHFTNESYFFHCHELLIAGDRLQLFGWPTPVVHSTDYSCSFDRLQSFTCNKARPHRPANVFLAFGNKHYANRLGLLQHAGACRGWKVFPVFRR